STYRAVRINGKDSAAAIRCAAGKTSGHDKSVTKGADCVEGQRAVRTRHVREGSDMANRLAVGADAIYLVVRAVAVHIPGDKAMSAEGGDAARFLDLAGQPSK